RWRSTLRNRQLPPVDIKIVTMTTRGQIRNRDRDGMTAWPGDALTKARQLSSNHLDFFPRRQNSDRLARSLQTTETLSVPNTDRLHRPVKHLELRRRRIDHNLRF